MLRKLTIVILLLFYSLASFGVSLNFFYCCGQLKTVSLKAKITGVENCPVQKDKNCCENKTVAAKVSVDQKNNGFTPLQLPASGDQSTTPPALFGNHLVISSLTFFQVFPEDPPEPFLPGRSVLFSVFRI